MTDDEDTPQNPGVGAPLNRAPAVRSSEGGTLSPAFDAVFQGEGAYVALCLRRLGVRERDLEDLTHDVFVIVHRQLEKYDPSRPIRPWLFGIALRVAIAYRRRAGHQLEVVRDAPDAADGTPLADEQLDDRKRRQLVLLALEQLRPEQKSVFIMHDIDGHTMPDIADALEIPLNTGYSRLRLARSDFAATIAKLMRGTRTP
jgi:RNA polymerase sigma-70 factor (ECF subfamily)